MQSTASSAEQINLRSNDVTSKKCLGTTLRTCSRQPMTGFFRNGCCETDGEDVGEHTVCVQVTADFLEFSKQAGNDLSTSVPEFGFVGLKPGDQWCVCAGRWFEAYQSGRAAKIVLEACHEGLLDYLPLEKLKEFGL